MWQPYDPATGLTAPLSKLASRALGLDEIAHDLADERVTAGSEVAREAGFEAQCRTAGGKPWRVICEVAHDIDADRSWSALVGSHVSSPPCSGACLPQSCSTRGVPCSSFPAARRIRETSLMEHHHEFSAEEARAIGERIGIDWASSRFDVEQFRMGLGVELEHGRRDPATNVSDDDEITTGKIAWAHLNEFPDYYTRLAEMESEAERYWAEHGQGRPGSDAEQT